jgi:hypothetical protein
MRIAQATVFAGLFCTFGHTSVSIAGEFVQPSTHGVKTFPDTRPENFTTLP